MTVNAPTQVNDRPTCAEPQWLEVVDAAFDRPGGPAGQILREVACPTCPVRVACLSFAVENAEHGVWAGTSANTRTRRRGTRLGLTYNLREVHHNNARTVRYDSAAVREWARAAGIAVPVKGMPKSEVFDAYDAAVGAA